MQKRGQATPLIILGIVIVIVALLLIYLRGGLLFGPITPDALGDKLFAIENHIETCIGDVGDEPIRRVGLQGGYLSLAEDTFRLHEGGSISYLCYNRQDDARCINRMLTLKDMEDELSEAMRNEMAKCLNVKKFERGFTMSIGQLSIATEIGNDNTVIIATLPLTLRKGDVVVKEDTFSETFPYPLGRLYKVNQDIIAVETEFGEFEHKCKSV